MPEGINVETHHRPNAPKTLANLVATLLAIPFHRARQKRNDVQPKNGPQHGLTLHGPLGAAVPTASINVDFHAPSRLGDVLDFRLRPTRIGRSSVGLSIEAYCGVEKRLSMESTLVFTKEGASKPDSWPEDLRARISQELGGLVKDDA